MIKTHGKFKEIDLAEIKPGGWLHRYLEIQREGLTGHLEAAGHPFDRMGWGAQKNVADPNANVAENWWPYEQTGYWIDGMVKCGYLLADDFLINKAKEDIEYVLAHSDTDGYLGPKFMKEAVNWNRWAHAVFFRAVLAYYGATKDKRIPGALKAHYLSGTSPHSDLREVCNVEEILWTYERTGDEKLLEHAVKAYKGFQESYGSNDTSLESMASDRVSTEHGVTFNEIAKLGAIMYIYTGQEEYLSATLNAYRKLDRDQMLIDGVCSSSEHLRGKDPLDSHETCDVADYTWSLGYLLMATGDAAYGDKIERACLNAAPGSVTSDFKGLQYFSSPNQVVADKSSNHNLFFKGSKWMSYRPNPGTECCPGNVNRIMPNYVSRTWMKDGEGAIAAVLYGPSSILTTAGENNTEVRITEETDYPFSEKIDFHVQVSEPVKFTLKLRIPGWCEAPQLTVNGKDEERALKPGTFIDLEREYADGDKITLTLPMKLKCSHWPRNGVGIERGPLVYSLRVEEDWQTDDTERNCTKEFPAWDLYPASKWNYALDINEEALEQEIEVIHKEAALEPWSIHKAPILLKVPAREIKGWELERSKEILSQRNDTGKMEIVKLEGDFCMTPQLPEAETIRDRAGEREMVTLVPYGCTKLRITVFPQFIRTEGKADSRL